MLQQQKLFKRATAEEHDAADQFEPPVKLQCTAQQNDGLTKFSVEIVQQLEFTTSAANSQPQQISTNVTVKAHTNASVKSDSPKSGPATPKVGLDVGTLVECVKQEPDNDFADLDQCAAALEKDAQGGAAFGGFSDLIGDDTSDEIITSDAFNDLISDISNYPELMKDFDFEEKPADSALKLEDAKDQTDAKTRSPLVNQNFSPPVFENQPIKNRLHYPNLDFAKAELSPAAQTLKQMAEQHQHKNQMGLSYNAANPRAPTSRSPYSDFQFGDYGSPNSNFHKNSPGFPQPDLIKQEMFQGEYDMKRKGTPGLYKQQYSPYSSPSSHGSPGNAYLTRGGGNANATPTGTPYGGGTPPRPPSGPGGANSTGTTLSINQAQQLHITQQSHGHAIQVSAGQHLQLSGDLKGNVSIAAHQGMHFNQLSGSNANSSSQPTGTNQSNQSSNQHSNSNGGANAHNVNMSQQQTQSNMGPMMNNTQQQMPRGQSGSMGNLMQGPNPGGPNDMQGPGSANLNGGPMMQHPGGLESYSMSQTQTINFTQQTLRQRTNGSAAGLNPNLGSNAPIAGNQMGQNAMGNRMMGNPQSLEQQKLLQQQQMLRAQQAAAMQQHLVRPPPPDYKSSAGMMQPRYAPSMGRRMTHQPMPPSGPMMRPHNIYMQQQQQMMASRNMYPRQQTAMPQMEPMQQGNSEWRHLVMSQQNSNFNPSMRPNFQQGFNMGANSMQMSAIQHQQMRSTQGMVPANMAQPGMGQNMLQNQGAGSLNQMNQQMLNQMQQQNLMQQNAQMSMSSFHLQQNQSLSVGNQPMQHQNNQLNNPSNNLNNFNPQSSDFSLEFLDNISAPDSGGFDQELLNSFDSDSGFHLDF